MEKISEIKKEPLILSCLGYELKDLRCNIPSFINNPKLNSHIKSSDNLSYLFTNKQHMGFYGFQSPEELKGKNIFDARKHMEDKIPIRSTEKAHLNDENVVRTEKSVIFQGIPALNYDGYMPCTSFLKMPIFDFNNKIKAILTIMFDSTKHENIKSLFNKYQDLYKNNNEQLCNKKFLDYIGLSQIDHSLTTRELECLISLSQYKNLKNAAKELTISPKTLETHLHNVKLKLNNHDLSDILKYFISPKYRKF